MICRKYKIFNIPKSLVIIKLYRYVCRLHKAYERSFLKGISEVAKTRRKRRHQTRKILLILDVAVESFSGAVLMGKGFYAYGDPLIWQHLFHRMTYCLYGILIPFTFLLNESRVRNTIVNRGWCEGMRSIFYSNAKIRRLQRLSERRGAIYQ